MSFFDLRKAKALGGGIKRSSKKKNKRNPNDQSPTITNFNDRSPIKVVFKRDRYNYPDRLYNFDIGDGIMFKDFPIVNVGTFIEQKALN